MRVRLRLSVASFKEASALFTLYSDAMVFCRAASRSALPLSNWVRTWSNYASEMACCLCNFSERLKLFSARINDAFT